MEAVDIIVGSKAVQFKGEARRLIAMGAVKFDGVKVDSNIEVAVAPKIVRIGKINHEFITT